MDPCGQARRLRNASRRRSNFAGRRTRHAEPNHATMGIVPAPSTRSACIAVIALAPAWRCGSHMAGPDNGSSEVLTFSASTCYGTP